jgi:hypothetical protein
MHSVQGVLHVGLQYRCGRNQCTESASDQQLPLVWQSGGYLKAPGQQSPIKPPPRGRGMRNTPEPDIRPTPTDVLQAKVLTDDEVRAGRHQYCAAAGVVGALVTSR